MVQMNVPPFDNVVKGPIPRTRFQSGGLLKGGYHVLRKRL